MKLTLSDLILPSLKNTRILVVGDVMLDRYWYGTAARVSQEAPVPVVNVDRVEDRPGGAANVALNIVSLGARCTLIGLVGNDEAAESLRSTLDAAGVECDFVVQPDWPSIVKLRVISQRQQLLRTDFEKPLKAPELHNAMQALLAKVAEHIQRANSVVIEDYDKGTISDPASLIAVARNAGVAVVVDPKLKPLSVYAGASIVKPNQIEFEASEGASTSEQDMVDKGHALCVEHNIDALVVTQGGDGMTVILADATHHHVPGRPVDVFDVTGAGDTAAATLAITASLGWDVHDCAKLANIASSLVVAKLGTATVSGPELAVAVRRAGHTDRGVVSLTHLIESVESARLAGDKIVFTNGCFDILHAGHVAYLEEARALGERLVVAINDDASVTRLKGRGRPVNSLERRARVLAGLSSVDWVVGFAEDTPENLLGLIKPDVLVKGGDYSSDAVVGADMVRAYGGEVAVLGLVEDCSTTAIVEKVRNQSAD
ncbi:MAG: bifunctional D-glycero-beta-D-manno-heptose-7-phosphate kinase/D-glycero-beta-D-manno-heptose 1-phosphate adenylyltransferase HldE [Proteobacteria bacterium]|nr:bifunctional D-glycero-beta-D-manno-heptose-7-phosphate kinase/D-glycero-beta-D-manno-heptose 1-phosphate adenylyltransferase HldE [Pseudomonadota bacterium]